MIERSPIRVMIVDESSVMRGMIARVLEAEKIEITGTAANTKGAIAVLQRTGAHAVNPEIMILDVQNGADAVIEIRKISPQLKIIVAGTINEANALMSIDALGNGAVELVAKPISRKNREETDAFTQELLRKVQTIAGVEGKTHLAADPLITTFAPSPPVAAEAEKIILRAMPPVFMPKAIAIASSTGGPKALQIVMEGIDNKLAHLPIFITQHMPKDFTMSLGLQLAKIAGLEGGEAKQGDIVKAGNIYLAPGDFHMLAEKIGGSIFIRLNQNEQENFCRPAADPMLRSLTKIYGKDLLVVVLTGMGQDGLAGARIAADAGGVVIAQDQITSVVWGMPGAVAKAGICNHVLPLPQIANLLIRLCI